MQKDYMTAPEVLLVTGASKGIGKHITDTLASEFLDVFAIASSDLIYRNSSRYNIHPIKFNIENINETDGLLSGVINVQKYNRIAVVLCASQIGPPGGLFDDKSKLKDWDQIYKINVLGNLSILKFVVANMQPDASLRVVFFGGGGAAYAYPEFSAYALSKVATIRAVENIGMEFINNKMNASIVALAPGAVETDMLAKVVARGGVIKTRTHISEPAAFVRNFIFDLINSLGLNGRFIHVRDDLNNIVFSENNSELFKLRRNQ
jgi:NADP-dependent 3-hydroxy acid dehydrogenase YdfG